MAANKMTGKKMSGENGGKERRQRMAGENGGKENSGRKWRKRTAGKKMKDKKLKYKKYYNNPDNRTCYQLAFCRLEEIYYFIHITSSLHKILNNYTIKT